MSSFEIQTMLGREADGADVGWLTPAAAPAVMHARRQRGGPDGGRTPCHGLVIRRSNRCISATCF